MAKTKRSSPKGPNLKVLYGVLVLVAVLGGGWIAYSLTSGGTAATAPIELSGIEDPRALLDQARGVALGPENGVQILVFSDFTCPACQGYTGFVEPQIKAEYVQSDQVRYVYYDFPIGGPGHEHGFVAARAARCAGEQDKFWEYHDLLFARQSEWSFARTAPVSQFLEYGDLLGLDRGSLSSCIRSDRFADVVTANRLLGERLGVGSTPTIFIGSRSVPDWRDYDNVKALIEQELATSKPASESNQ